jgi:hypothetical protein
VQLCVNYWTKVLFAAIGGGSKIIVDYVIRRLNALLTWGKGWLKGLTFAETPLARSPDSPGASRATEEMLLIAAYQDVPRSARIWSSQPRNRKAFMKFVSLRTKRAHRSIKLDKRFATATAEHHQIHTYTDLRQQIHDDLRVQHPEWVQPDGKSPKCDSYEARLVELLAGLRRRESNQSIVDPHRLLEQGSH